MIRGEAIAEHLDAIFLSTGEQLLMGNGTVPHLQAMEKVETVALIVNGDGSR